jgi:hypothetical protein
MPPDPQTPKKPARMKEQVEQAMREFISRVCNKYDLSLEMPGDSPMKRVDFGKSLEEKCVLKIRHLSWTASMSSSWEKFDAQAGDLFLGWRSIEKPLKATPTIMQRRQALLECLYGTLKEESDKAIQLYQGSPLSSRSAHTLWPKIDDSPVLFSIESKRIREEQSEALCHLTRRARTATFSKPQLPRPKSSEDAIASYRSDEKRKLAATRSANTSFTSNNSSVFDSSTLASTPAASFAGAKDEDPNRTTFGTGQPIITPQPDNLRISGYDLSGIEFEAVPNVFPGVSIYKSAALEQSDLRASGGLPKDLLAYDLDDKPLIGSQENELKTQLQAVFRKSCLVSQNERLLMGEYRNS